MKKIKLVTIVGTRPEIIRLSIILKKFDKYFDHILINTNQNFDYELNEIFFNQLKLKKPKYNLSISGKTPSETIGNIIIAVDKVLEEVNPDAVFILGDTNSALSALSAKKRKIPIFHMEAGNRCFDQRVPEEINRKIVDHIADINLTYSKIARDYLIMEGIKPDRIIKVGSPMKEVLNFYMLEINKSKILKKLKIKKNKYFLISCHREENLENNLKFKQLISMIKQIYSKYKLPIIFPAHPRTQKKFRKNKITFHNNIKIIQPLGYIDYNFLSKNSFIFLSDSGTLFEESSILDLKSINIRDTHERPEAMEKMSSITNGFNFNTIENTINYYIENKSKIKEDIVDDYNENNVSDKVVKIINSYIDFINFEVWKKN